MECIPPAVLEELRREFLEETREALEAAEGELATLAASDGAAREEALHRINRRVHALKGAAGMFGFPHVTAFCHRVEDFLETFETPAPPAPDALAHLARAFLLLHATFAGEHVSEDLSSASIDDWTARLPPAPPSGESAAPCDPRATGAGFPTAPARGLDGRGVSVRSIRVPGTELDGLAELAGEIQLTSRRLLLRLESRGLPGGDRGDALRDGVLLARRAALLRRRVRALRLIPLGPLFAPLRALVRALADEAGKEVELEVLGEDTRVDRSMLDALAEPLVHLVRNAIDHGLEDPEGRALEGKPPRGRLQVAASSDGTHVRLVVSDDGRGVDRAAVRRAARDMGDPLPDEADDAELLGRLFLDGFSTRERASQISGRGIGLHAVRRAVSEFHGMVDIQSEPGRGTRVALRVPESITLTQGLLVQAGGHRVVIPAHTVTGVHKGDEAVPGLRRLVPFARGRDTADERAPDGPGRRSMVVVGVAERRLGIVVDHVAGRQELLVRPLGPLLQHHPVVSGVAELADGGLAWVLDPARFLEGRPSPDGEPAATAFRSPGGAGEPPGPESEWVAGNWLVIALRREHFAVDARAVIAVLSPREPTPVPFALPQFLGVLLHRGRILPVFDGALLRDRGAAPLGAGMLVALRTCAEFALRVSAVPGMIRPREDSAPIWNGRTLPVLDVGALPLKTLSGPAEGIRTAASREVCSK